MRVKVFDCSGAIAKDCRATSFLLDHDVFLTHSHPDHILSLPLMLDSVGGLRSQPLRVHALAETLLALKNHIFNNIIWPDFSVIPSPKTPYIAFHEIEVGKLMLWAAKTSRFCPPCMLCPPLVVP